jgi:hypothetical protein
VQDRLTAGVIVVFDPLRFPQHVQESLAMSKGMDRKKETKKKPAKTMLEKRALKQAKKAEKGFKYPT